MAHDITFRFMNALKIDEDLSFDKSQFQTIAADIQNATPEHALLCAVKDNHIVGFVWLYAHPQASNINIEFLEVAPDERQHGIGKMLVEKTFELATEKKKTVTGNGFTQDGKSHLQRAISRCCAKYGDNAFEVIGRA